MGNTDRKIVKKDGNYEITSVETLTEEEMLAMRTALLRDIKDFSIRLTVRRKSLAEINVALGRKAEDETA